MMNKAAKRYLREFGLSMAAYVILIFASALTVPKMADSPWRTLLALSPVVPAIFMVFAFVRYLNDIDELQQRIQLMAIGFAAGATGLTTFAYGFLEIIGFPHLPMIWILPMLVLLWGLGTAYFSRKYQ